MSDESGSTVEVWKTIAEFPQYSVSSIGRVRRTTPWNRQCGLLKLQTLKKGYKYVELCNNGVRIGRLVSRLVAQAFLEPASDPRQNEVNHKNGIKADNRPDNLEWVTRGENIQHCYDVLGRKQRRGEAHSLAKLTEANIIAIRRMLSEGTPRRAAAMYFGVTKQTIGYIWRGKTWRHVA